MTERDPMSGSDEAHRERTPFDEEPAAVPPEANETGEGFDEAVEAPRLRPTEDEDGSVGT